MWKVGGAYDDGDAVVVKDVHIKANVEKGLNARVGRLDVRAGGRDHPASGLEKSYRAGQISADVYQQVSQTLAAQGQ